LNVEYEEAGGEPLLTWVTVKRGCSPTGCCRSIVVPQYIQLPLSPIISTDAPQDGQ
jgi:hypothetical protein